MRMVTQFCPWLYQALAYTVFQSSHSIALKCPRFPYFTSSEIKDSLKILDDVNSCIYYLKAFRRVRSKLRVNKCWLPILPESARNL